MFGVGTGELLALAVIALLVLGPDKLPKFAADAARVLRQLRQMANNAREDVRRELGPELQDISLDDLNPRSLMRRHLLDDLDVGDDLDGALDEFDSEDPVRSRRRASGGSPGAAAGGGSSPSGGAAPYDPEAT